jgi:hypothetical protein
MVGWKEVAALRTYAEKNKSKQKKEKNIAFPEESCPVEPTPWKIRRWQQKENHSCLYAVTG